MEQDGSEIWDVDIPIRLDKLVEKIQQLQEKYGKRALLILDAGYNNVCIRIKPSKK